VHFNQVNIHRAVIEETPQSVLGSSAVWPRSSLTDLLKMALHGTHWHATSGIGKTLVSFCCSSFSLRGHA
jgi:hypothetical protein